MTQRRLGIHESRVEPVCLCTVSYVPDFQVVQPLNLVPTDRSRALVGTISTVKRYTPIVHGDHVVQSHRRSSVPDYRPFH